MATGMNLWTIVRSGVRKIFSSRDNSDSDKSENNSVNRSKGTGSVATLLLTNVVTGVFSFVLANMVQLRSTELNENNRIISVFHETGVALEEEIEIYITQSTDNSNKHLENDGIARAFSRHVNAVRYLRDLVGEETVIDYVDNLARLRKMIDVLNAKEDAVTLSQARMDLLYNRELLEKISKIKKNEKAWCILFCA
jgi:hypothetical protein